MSCTPLPRTLTSEERMAEIAESIQANFNRMWPMAEELRQLRHSVDLVAAQMVALQDDVRQLTRAVNEMQTALSEHAKDEAAHGWLSDSGGNGGSPFPTETP